MIIRYLLCALIAYLLGSISTGILIAGKSGHDIRKEGSHNTGASNALRILGLKGGALTFLGDFLKAALAVTAGLLIAQRNGGLIAGLFVVLGHNWPVFFGFQGGKGIACSTAVLLILYPWQGAAAALICLAVIAVTKYISVGSLTMLTVFFILLIFTEPFWPVAVWALVLLILGVYRHRGNIERLRNGTENKIGQKPKEKYLHNPEK
ncbi:MAG: glycerol-3-phosphate 1-O-acyltransferase PlsY [Clostridia bacterium]|nr:glycerol-3-phosphate 1-O-acyltransferase PlsY [Clostridia bacterium]